ncbi:MAG TPA: hypothetical protein VMS17_29835 [Gemmataceae bacterium]|nr:hypothetical protein [Gemmataceae bacterium]
MNDGLYKAWLRDEFCFRCVSCLCRELWEPNGSDLFGVEHREARSVSAERAGDCDNLLCSCLMCNACRREEPLPFDPSTVAPAMHLRMRAHGTLEALTRDGRMLCDLYHLNRPALVRFRRFLLDLMDQLVNQPNPQTERALRHILGIPDDLPNLRSRRPPGGNARPEGIDGSWFERRRRGELRAAY